MKDLLRQNAEIQRRHDTALAKARVDYDAFAVELSTLKPKDIDQALYDLKRGPLPKEKPRPFLPLKR